MENFRYCDTVSSFRKSKQEGVSSKIFLSKATWNIINILTRWSILHKYHFILQLTLCLSWGVEMAGAEREGDLIQHLPEKKKIISSNILLIFRFCLSVQKEEVIPKKKISTHAPDFHFCSLCFLFVSRIFFLFFNIVTLQSNRVFICTLG